MNCFKVKFSFPDADYPSELNIVTKNINNSLQQKIKDIIIEGLKLKGFNFNSDNEMELFIKSNCYAVDNEQSKTKIYYVNNTPFLLHEYGIEIKIEGNKLNANYGKYAFL